MTFRGTRGRHWLSRTRPRHREERSADWEGRDAKINDMTISVTESLICLVIRLRVHQKTLTPLNKCAWGTDDTSLYLNPSSSAKITDNRILNHTIYNNIDMLWSGIWPILHGSFDKKWTRHKTFGQFAYTLRYGTECCWYVYDSELSCLPSPNEQFDYTSSFSSELNNDAGSYVRRC